MTTTIDITTALRAGLATKLANLGYLTSPTWQAAFRSVPRHAFVPHFATYDQTGTYTHHDVTDPDPNRRTAALVTAYTNDTLLTRFDNNGVAISSSTEPSLMAAMLEALDAKPGHRVLEIGAGTGYNAALLCHVLGEDNVTTIDVDPQLVDTARTALAAAGYEPAVLWADGAGGVPERAPFDRIIATCGVDRVPPAWIQQLAPTGAILVNVSAGIVLLRRDENGGVTGRFLGSAGFMPLRSAGDPAHMSAHQIVAAASGAPEGTREAAVPADMDFAATTFFADLVAAHGRLVLVHGPDGEVASYRWVHPPSGSWARVELRQDGPAVIAETGSRRLWTELAPILDAWHAAGRPPVQRYRLSVAADGAHTLWLGESSWAMRPNKSKAQ